MSRLLDALYPPVCHLCDNLLVGDERFICTSCRALLPRSGYAGMPDNPVEQRLAGLIPFEVAAAPFIYERGNRIALLIQDFKYRNFPSLARCMGEMVYDELVTGSFLTGVEGVVPVPLHWTRLLRRTYNQTAMLARGLAGRLGVPVIEVLKARRHVSQTHQSHEQRRSNAAGKYTARPGAPIAGRTLILLDDVCTTGSTLLAAASALLAEYPTVRLRILTLAATR